jgi:hypothetical protein
MKIGTLLASAALAATLALAGAANAAPFTGTFWNAPSNTLSNISQAITFAGNNAATATFTSTGINYGDASTNWDIGSLADFLNADSGTINPNSVGTNYFQESVILITGVARFVNGQQYTVTSDDGFRLSVGNTLLSTFAGIRAPNNSTSATWTGVTGNYTFSLWYFEGQETQAQLVSNITPVPVPAAGLLLVGALGGLAALRRRKAVAA